LNFTLAMCNTSISISFIFKMYVLKCHNFAGCAHRVRRISRILFRYNRTRRLCEYEKHQQKYFDCVAAIRNTRKLQLTGFQQNRRYCYLYKCLQRCWQTRFTGKVFITCFNVNRVKFYNIDWPTRYRLNAQISLVSHIRNNPHFT